MASERFFLQKQPRVHIPLPLSPVSACTHALSHSGLERNIQKPPPAPLQLLAATKPHPMNSLNLSLSSSSPDKANVAYPASA